MAKIRVRKRPSVSAPDLTRSSQRINVPRDSFGGAEGRALEGLGNDVQFSAQTIGKGLARVEERRTSTEASTAFRNVPINELNSLEAAKKNPGDLATFQERQTKEFDDRMETIRRGLGSDRARLKFDEKTLATRTSTAKNAATWARAQEVVQGRNAVNSDISNQINASAGDIGNLQSYRDESIRLINEAEANGFLINGKGQKQDASVIIQNTLRAIDLEVANSLIQNNPAALVAMIEADVMPGLTEDDKRVKTNQAISSARNAAEKAELTTRDSYLSTRKGLQAKIDNRTATFQELENHVRSLDAAVATGDETAAGQQAWLERARDKANKSEEDLLREATQKKVRGIKATEAAKQITGTGGATKPSASKRSNALMDFVNEFQGFDIVSTGAKTTENKDKFELKDKDNPNTRMSDILDFWTRVSDAQDAQLLSESEGNMFFKQLIPVMRSKISSKHFEEVAAPWWKEAITFSLAPNVSREADKYSDAFSNVLSLLEGTPSQNTTTNQAKVIRYAFQLADEAKVDKIEDLDKRVEAINKIGNEAIQMLNNENHPSARGLKTNAVIEMKGDENTSQIETDAQGNRAIVTRDSKGKAISFEEIQ